MATPYATISDLRRELELKTTDLEAKTAELQTKMAELQTKTVELQAKTTELGTSNERKIALQATLDSRTVRSTTLISLLESKLTTKQTELERVQSQLDQLQTSEVARLTASSSWAAAATLLRAQVVNKQSALDLVNATEDGTRFILLSKALADQHYQLGNLYLKANDIPRAERFMQKAYDKRLKLLDRESSKTRRAQQQLCKILRKTANETKIRRATALYREYWERQSLDKFVLECGHELGCLYQEQGRHGEALPLFRAVWEKRRDHSNPAERALAMETVESLLSTETATGRKAILEWLWANHTGQLIGTPMLKHADALVAIYWEKKKKNYVSAEPILAALWAVRIGDIQIPTDMSDAAKKARLGVWFVTGFRYGVALAKVGVVGSPQLRDELYSRAKAIFQQLWTERRKLPPSVESDVTIYKLADNYAGMLLYFADPTLAQNVAGEAWQLATPRGTAPALEVNILYVGNRYAKALNKNGHGKSVAAKNVYKILFRKWKELSQNNSRDGETALAAINCGYSLLEVLKAIGKGGTTFVKNLKAELEGMERDWSAAPQRPLALE